MTVLPEAFLGLLLKVATDFSSVLLFPRPVVDLVCLFNNTVVGYSLQFTSLSLSCDTSSISVASNKKRVLEYNAVKIRLQVQREYVLPEIPWMTNSELVYPFNVISRTFPPPLD